MIGTAVVVGAAGVLTGADVDSMDEAVIADEDLTDEAGLDVADSTVDVAALAAHGAAPFINTDLPAVEVDFTAAVAAGFMVAVEEASTVVEAEDSTAVAEAMAAATGK